MRSYTLKEILALLFTDSKVISYLTPVLFALISFVLVQYQLNKDKKEAKNPVSEKTTIFFLLNLILVIVAVLKFCI